MIAVLILLIKKILALKGGMQFFQYKQNTVHLLKFIYSEKATKFCEIFPLLLTVCTVVKSKEKISQNFCGLLRIYEKNIFDTCNLTIIYLITMWMWWCFIWGVMRINTFQHFLKLNRNTFLVLWASEDNENQFLWMLEGINPYRG